MFLAQDAEIYIRAHSQPALAGGLSFGSVTVGQNKTLTLTITNNGNVALNITSISYPAGFSGNWASGAIASGASREITVTFTPTGAGDFGGEIAVESDKTEGEASIAINGTGVAAPTRILALSGNLSFGEVEIGQTATRTLTIANNGNSVLTVSSLDFPVGFSGNWNGGEISPEGSRSVTVTFAPTEAKSYSGNIGVNSDRTSGTPTRAVSGSGVEADPEPDDLDPRSFFGDDLYVFPGSEPGTDQWYFSFTFKSIYHFAGTSWYFFEEFDCFVYLSPEGGSLSAGFWGYFLLPANPSWVFTGRDGFFGDLRDSTGDGVNDLLDAEAGSQPLNGFLFLVDPFPGDSPSGGWYFFGEYPDGNWIRQMDNPSAEWRKLR